MCVGLAACDMFEFGELDLCDLGVMDEISEVSIVACLNMKNRQRY